MTDIARRHRAAILLFAALLIGASAARTDRGDAPGLLWARRLPLEAGGARVVAVQGPVTYAIVGPDVGETGVPELRAHDTASGELVWSRKARALPGQILTDLHSGRDVAFVVGNAADSNALVVRAREASDGLNRWARISYLPVDRVAVTDLLLGGPRLFVLGNAGDRRMVRALDADSGAFLWQDMPLENDTGSAMETVAAGIVQDGRLVVAGRRDRLPETGDSSTYFREYRVRDGAIVWDSEVDGDEMTVRGLAGAADAALVAAGTVVDSATGDSLWATHAVAHATGTPLWNERPYRLPSAAEAVAGEPHTDVVYVAGWVRGARTLPVVHAHDSHTGELLWEGGGAAVKEGAFYDLVVVDGAVLAVGTGRPSGTSRSVPLIEALDTTTGASVWARVGDVEGRPGRLDTVDVHRGRLVVGGAATRGDGAALVRVYALDE